MKLLAVESATLSGGVALQDGDRLLGEITLNIAITHSERLMSAVDRLLDDCGLAPADLDGLAVSVGPGSFTGLRVGLATVKALAMALDLPVAAVPTLDALAARLPFADAPVCPILDARKKEVYLSLYRWRGSGMAREWDYLALPPELAAARLEAPVILLGDGIEACRPWLERLGAGVRVAPAAQRLPSAAVVAGLGRAALAAGAGVDAEALAPLYLRPSEAQLKARRS
jgi:tRNA threonylcarbamoyladenosine biosynthesis protein TsaB